MLYSITWQIGDSDQNNFNGVKAFLDSSLKCGFGKPVLITDFPIPSSLIDKSVKLIRVTSSLNNVQQLDLGLPIMCIYIFNNIRHQ